MFYINCVEKSNSANIFLRATHFMSKIYICLLCHMFGHLCGKGIKPVGTPYLPFFNQKDSDCWQDNVLYA